MAVYLHNELCRYDNSDDDNDNIEQVIDNSNDDNDYIEQVIDNSDDEENDNIEEVIDSCDGHVCCLSKPSIEFLLRPIKTMLTISLDLSTLFGFGQSGSNNPNAKYHFYHLLFPFGQHLDRSGNFTQVLSESQERFSNNFVCFPQRL